MEVGISLISFGWRIHGGKIRKDRMIKSLQNYKLNYIETENPMAKTAKRKKCKTK